MIAAEYETDDSPEKVKAFYEDKMKDFGTTLVCSGHSGGSDVHISTHKDDDDKKLNCSDTSGDGWEIKAGTERQRAPGVDRAARLGHALWHGAGADHGKGYVVREATSNQRASELATETFSAIAAIPTAMPRRRILKVTRLNPHYRTCRS